MTKKVKTKLEKMKTKPKTENNSGITLVALIITIIILIILAAVTIKTMFDENLAGIAIEGGEDYKQAEGHELNELGELNNRLEGTINVINGGNSDGSQEDNNGSQVVVDTTNPSDVGKTVVYTPTNGSFSTTISGTEYSGYGNQTFSTSDQAFTWKLWKTDTQNIYLISDKATTKKLGLSGVNGYNNGVKLLDDICNACYSNSTYGATARNLKIEDVVDTAGITATDTNAAKYGTQPYSYTFAYPQVWVDNEDTVDKAKANVSVAYPYTNNATTQLTASPTFTFRYYQSISTSIFKTNYGNLVIGTGTSNGRYWLSSRTVYVDSDLFEFAIQDVESSNIGGLIMLRLSNGSDLVTGTPENALRPLVIIPQSNVILTEASDGTFTLSPR